MKTVLKCLDEMNPAPYNPRVKLVPGDPEYDNLKQSIEKFDNVQPIVWNERTGNIVGGHRRYDVLRDLGRTEDDVIKVNLSEDDEKLLNLALNNIRGRWDEELLKPLLADLREKADLTVAGFDSMEVDRLLAGFACDIDDFFAPKQEKNQPQNGEQQEKVQCPECGHWFKPEK